MGALEKEITVPKYLNVYHYELKNGKSFLIYIYEIYAQ